MEQEMVLDALFEQEAQPGLSSYEPLQHGLRQGAYEDAHEEDRLLGDLSRWARRRGFDRHQQRLLREALLNAFERLSDLPAPG